MTTKKFCTGCALLWGPAWKSEAARQLGVSLPSINRYATGEREVPDVLIERIAKLLMQRQGDIGRMLEKL